jgi:tetratricopeptide (TPR) repeat protein
MTCIEFTSLIDSYLQGNLSDENLEAFEQHYFECDLCYAELKVAERLISKEVPIVIEGREAKLLYGFDWKLTRKSMLAFASFFILALTIVLVTVINHSSRLRLLYNLSDFSPPVYIQSEIRGQGTGSINGAFARAMAHYNRKEYSHALDILKGVSGSAQNPQVIFFKGICYLLTDERHKAIKEFDIIIENMNPSYYDEAIYYKAIALLRLNKKEKALEQLKNLAGMFSPYAPKAKRLIDKINKL